jgi:hypothetical protein
MSDYDLSYEQELHILCLNACVSHFNLAFHGNYLTRTSSGVMMVPKDLFTVQGYDMHMGTNVIVCSSFHLHNLR